MTKLERLRLEALDGCRFRGHVMNKFKRDDYYKNTIRYSNCKICDMQVVINSKPMPNEINIGGEAVALECTIKPDYLARINIIKSL